MAEKGRNAQTTYLSLNPERIVETSQKLSRRISERFPDSSLSRLSHEIRIVAERAAVTSAWIAKPNLWLRSGTVFLIVVIIAVAISAFPVMQVSMRFESAAELLQAIESAINDMVFIAIAVVFLLTWENRIKRNRALKALHELRSLAHVIDMHQLTKDPERVMNREQDTPSSPERKMTAFQLTRYLDYCSEMLAILSKIAAVYVQSFDDSVTLSAVNEVENLTTGLSRKIWQKIMILDRMKRSPRSAPSAS